jgi:hypothetical protein
LDNVLGHLYVAEDGKNFDGVIGKDLSNPIPVWAEHGAERKTVPYTVATDMDSPNPDSPSPGMGDADRRARRVNGGEMTSRPEDQLGWPGGVCWPR